MGFCRRWSPLDTEPVLQGKNRHKYLKAKQKKTSETEALSQKGRAHHVAMCLRRPGRLEVRNESVGSVGYVV